MRGIAFTVHMMGVHLPFFPPTPPYVWILDEEEQRIKEENRTS